ncbi:threonine synthase [bacterium]|nr:MAG: threonine synthase [bacterium]
MDKTLARLRCAELDGAAPAEHGWHGVGGPEPLRCAEAGCGGEAIEGNTCPRCGGLLEFAEPHGIGRDALVQILRDRSVATSAIDRSGVWRFRELLPHIDEARIVSLDENEIPLQEAPRSAAWSGVERVAVYHCGRNPSGSFKDAGMTVAVSFAAARGSRVALCASTGNTSAAMAAYAARAGMGAFVLAPAGGVSQAKVAQTLAYGAHVLTIEGDFDDALRLARAVGAASREVALVNSVDPYRIEGQKCVAFAMLEQRRWRAPDWVVLPGGNLGNVSALGKGFREALALGLSDRLPRLCVVQASGAAPFARAWESGAELEPVKAQTVASAIRIGNPVSWRKARRELRACDGLALALSDEDILEARRAIGGDGLGCEPASAASLAGVRELRRRGVMRADEDVVCILTGHVLKDSSVVEPIAPEPVANSVDAVLSAMLKEKK